jgi:deoxyribodipyrimidine photo-lyase
MSALVWFRQDLRLADNPALTAAAKHGPVTALYILDDETPGKWQLGSASRWWLHYSLEALAASLKKHDVSLILRRGNAEDIVRKVAKEIKADAVFWNRCYEPSAIARDTALKAALEKAAIKVTSFSASLLHEPWTVKTGGGTVYKVYTPYWKAAKKLAVEQPLPAPRTIEPGPKIASEKLADWDLLPTHPDWAGGIRKFWKPGEAEAKKRFGEFMDDAIRIYATHRDQPDVDASSRLSPHLHFGEISPRQIWHATQAARAKDHAVLENPIDKFLSEVAWRDFAYYLLYHFPDLPEKPYDKKFTGFPYKKNTKHLHAWQRGLTGYPMVDAGMRQLWETGWMHNRVRMIVASFLVKHLRISWADGAAWFWDTLVDADLASNSLGWQWIAGSGPDASPWHRIFNPIIQGQKFDPKGGYIRRFVPELAKLPDKYIHAPWQAPADVLAQAGVKLGETYPLPLVDHAIARQEALDVFKDNTR